MLTLPIDSLLPEIAASLGRGPNLVVEAPPGAGKTTRVPPALLDAGLAGGREVWVLEPRRLAARLSARRVAEERGESVGETVGYQVRFDEVGGPRTRLRFLTEGVLTRRLLADPRLERAGVVVLDEFHERHLQADLAVALLRRLQLGPRPDLRLVAMSATLDAAPVAEFLGAPVLRSEGRCFHVEVEHLARPDERPLEQQVESAVGRLVAEGLDGDVLVFLPGAAEIRRAQSACEQLAARHDLAVLPLHGELPAEEQDRAVRRAGRRKVILSTNVAETSVTVEGVAAVVDSGLARVASHSPWSGLPTLKVSRVSQASAAQRAGRAGRTREGRALRLYTARDFQARPAHETPEVRRLDLAGPALELHAAGVADLRKFEWFEAPDAPALEAAERLLRRLGALNEAGEVTRTGRRMLRLPLHPRLARLIAEADARGVGAEACVVAALASERDVRERQLFAGATPPDGGRGSRAAAKTHGSSDLLELYDLFTEAGRSNFSHDKLRRLGLDGGAVRAVERVRRQLQRALVAGGGGVAQGRGEGGADAARALTDGGERELLISILAGYPDRLARRRESAKGAQTEGVELLLAGGGAAVLAPESVVRGAEFVVAVDAGERGGGGVMRGGRRAPSTVVRLASAVEPEWLLDLFPERVSEAVEAEWNAEAERAEAVSRLLYDDLVLTETRAADARGAEVSRVLAGAALAAGWERFAEREAVENFLARVEFLSRALPEAGLPALGEPDVRAALEAACEGRRSFAELRAAARAGGLSDSLRRRLTPEQQGLLARMAPERVKLASGRQARVNYERGKPPWVASRLQDFFGMREAPRVAGGRAEVVVHLLAPNNRPVQVTTDLSGFWSRHYARVRRELARRYPRHPWPEDPHAGAGAPAGKKS
jgi:ATP-dependent helicase HrpB